MWKYLFRWTCGYVEVALQGEQKERFLNLCRGHEIYVWGVAMEQEVCRCYMDLSDFYRLPKLVRKTKVHPIIQQKYGMPFLIDRLRKQKGIVLGFLSGILAMYILSLFLWSIDVEGQSYYTKEQILNCLQGEHIYIGQRLRSVDCKKIEELLRGRFSNIGWVSAERKGTRLMVKLVETQEAENEKSEKRAVHLVAPRDGTVDEIVTRSGEAVVKKGQQVKKGDVLIKGILEVKNDDGEIVEKEITTADGDVYLQEQRSYENRILKLHKVKKYIGRQKKTIVFSFFYKKIYLTNIFKGFNKEEKYDIISSVCDLPVQLTNLLPVTMEKRVVRAYQEIEETYTEQELKELLQQEWEQYKLEELSKQIPVLRERIRYKQDRESMCCSVEYKVREKVGSYREISNEEWRMLKSNGLDGNND